VAAGTALGLALVLSGTAQLARAQGAGPAATNAATSRVDERLRALRAEATRLAGESRSLIDQVRALEVERDVRAAEAERAEADVEAARQRFATITQRVDALEVQRVAGLPELQAQLVQVYKHGRTGYVRMLLNANGLRDFARVSRAVSALTFREERAVREHRQTLASLRTERDSLEGESRTALERSAAAQAARALAERAVASRTALIAQIDSRRDLTAQYVGELQEAHARIREQVQSGGVTAVSVPLAPFQGGLEWPVPGRITGRFGQRSSQLGGGLVRNGIEIAAAPGTPVRAVHGGTVSYAEGFTGLGTVVILDHGEQNHTVYGYLQALTVGRGDRVEAGATVGRVGPSPAGPAAAYFEMHVDGRFVDPVQWLRPR
jgi:septal ring factor EnvC (AmiA/AmiB activator)